MKKIFKLTNDQQNKFDVLTWLFSDDDADRGTGRTTLMAMAFITKALKNPGHWVNFTDHHQDIYGNHRTIMAMAIEQNLPPQLKEQTTIGLRALRIDL